MSVSSALEGVVVADQSRAAAIITDPTIRLMLDELERDGRIRLEGTGRAATWLRTLS